MSDTVRSYSGTKSGLSFGSSRRRGGGVVPAIGIVLFVLAVAGIYWISRDTHEIAEFLPARQPLQVRVDEAVATRTTLAASPIWSVLPEDGTGDLRNAVQGPLPVPEWLAKNVANRELYWFGDFKTGDGVLVSRMTRVGTIAARLGVFMPAVERDWAGGLNLYTLPNQSLYFAVRGRILIASGSRRAVIEALTLDDSERARLDGYLVEPPQNTHIAGVARLSSEDAERWGVDRLEFGVVTEPDRFGVLARGKLTDETSPLATMLANARPVALTAPEDAPAALVVQVDMPLRDLTIALGRIAGTNWPDAAQWEDWSVPPNEERDRPAMADLLAQLGPELELTVHSVDPNEVMPVPEIVVRCQKPPATVAELIKSFPKPANGPSIDAVRASYDPESGVLDVPAPGGDSLEPSAAMQAGEFVFSTSRTRLNQILAAPAGTHTALPGTNNAYLRIEPNRALDTIATAGRVLAENDLLKGYTVDTFEDEIADWRRQLATIESVEAVLRTTDGMAELECEMRFSAR